MGSLLMGLEVGGWVAIGGKLFCSISPPAYSSSWKPNLPIMFVNPWYNLVAADDVGGLPSAPGQAGQLGARQQLS